jgi:hypothetical protein
VFQILLQAIKTISVKELKGHWAEVERQVRNGENVRGPQPRQACRPHRAAKATSRREMGGTLGGCRSWEGQVGRGDGARGPRGALVIYLDTSAFVKLYIREAGSELVEEHVTSQDHPPAALGTPAGRDDQCPSAEDLLR